MDVGYWRQRWYGYLNVLICVVGNLLVNVSLYKLVPLWWSYISRHFFGVFLQVTCLVWRHQRLPVCIQYGFAMCRHEVLIREFVHRHFDVTLLWRINGHDSVSNHQPHDCLLNRLFRRRSKKTSKLFVTGLCAGNSPGTGEFPAQMASNAENVSIWWRHHDLVTSDLIRCQRPISLTVFHHTPNVIGIPFCYHPKSNARIATNVCTLHDSRAVEKFVAISQPGIYLQWKEISIEFDL